MTDFTLACWPEWQLLEPLDSGCYGTVYVAVHRADPRMRSAIKIISLPSDSSQIDSLREEGKTEDQIRWYFRQAAESCCREISRMAALKGLSHIVSAEDFATLPHDSDPGYSVCIRMELLKPLKTYLSDKHLSEVEVIQIGLDISDALSICHQKGILHLDIKPDNLFVNDRLPTGVLYKLGDFGTAMDSSEDFDQDLTGGTPAYMSPEALNQQPLDERSDLYSLGLTLYQLMNRGRLPFLSDRPFHNPDEKEVALKTRLSGAPLPSPADASDAFTAVLQKACAFRPEDRYATATDMSQALRRLLTAEGSAPASPAPARWGPKSILLPGCALLGLLLALWLIARPLLRNSESLTASASHPPLLEAVQRVPTHYETLQQELKNLEKTVQEQELLPLDGAVLRVPRSPCFACSFIQHLNELLPAWDLDASATPLSLTLSDGASSHLWAPSLYWDNGQDVPLLFQADGIFSLDVNPAGARPLLLSLYCRASGTSFVARYDLASGALSEIDLPLLLGTNAPSFELESVPGAEGSILSLTYRQPGLPRLTAVYDSAGNLTEIRQNDQIYDCRDVLPALKGVEYLP